ncbi:hypothetical protein JCM3774_000356 [Rhodotorula dairenensis]
MLGSILGSLVGATAAASASSSSSSSPRSDSPTASSSDNSTTPTTPAEPTELSSAAPAPEEQDNPFERSAFFQRLRTKGRHDRRRIKEIQERALKDTPPKEPDPWECCGGSCGIECVVTMWWEEEKTWRDLRPDWRQIKQRLQDEEEDRQREAEEEAAIAGPGPTVAAEAPTSSKASTDEQKMDGTPAVEIALEDETRQKLSL